ncbi:hypothetical protein [Kibdelosporangium aridum]|uniref:hypothetical protein n=1 Tax=Kibdelosporangium aridum TaxID=2030 RepID=UPI000A0629E7|nr:hypothetical protein [Kibdelosporangium aridum]
MNTRVAVWLLVAVLFSLVIALSAALLKTKEGATTPKTISSSAIAFAGTMTLCMTVFGVTGLM